MDLIKGQNKEGHYKNGIYGAYMDVQRMIRKDGFKLLVYPKIEKVLLFDLENDPEEITDVAGKPENSDKVNTMFKELLALQKVMGDELELTPLYNKMAN